MMNWTRMKHLIQVSLSVRVYECLTDIINYCLESPQSDDDSEDEEYQAYFMEDESDDEGVKQERTMKAQYKKPV